MKKYDRGEEYYIYIFFYKGCKWHGYMQGTNHAMGLTEEHLN